MGQLGLIAKAGRVCDLRDRCRLVPSSQRFVRPLQPQIANPMRERYISLFEEQMQVACRDTTSLRNSSRRQLGIRQALLDIRLDSQDMRTAY